GAYADSGTTYTGTNTGGSGSGGSSSASSSAGSSSSSGSSSAGSSSSSSTTSGSHHSSSSHHHRDYTVVHGDTLSGIAAKEGVSDWHTLYNENKSVVGANPDLIYPGQVLTLG